MYAAGPLRRRLKAAFAREEVVLSRAQSMLALIDLT